MNLRELVNKYKKEIILEVENQTTQDNVDGYLQTWIGYSDPTTDFYPEVIQEMNFDGEIASRIIDNHPTIAYQLAVEVGDVALEEVDDSLAYDVLLHDVDRLGIYWGDEVEDIYDIIRDRMSERSIELFGVDVTDFYDTGEGVELHQELHQLGYVELSKRFE